MNIFEETQYILKKYGIHANKSLGQNFLISDEIVSEMIEKSDINQNDLVIEIGPGLGTLTSRLLETAGKVIAVELDDRMIPILEERFKLYTNFTIIHDDILKVDLKELIKKNIGRMQCAPTANDVDDTIGAHGMHPQMDRKNNLQTVKIVANLPYYITTPIIMKLLEEQLPVQSITVMVQQEVAERLVATPGNKKAGAITYSVYYYAEAKEVVHVNRNSFIPAPNVDSQVIQLNLRQQPPVQVQNKELMFQLIKYAFMQRRKTLVNALENAGLSVSKSQITAILHQLGIDEKIRGEALSLEQFGEIANVLEQEK